jgi:phosphoribosylamine--glycine ligase
MHILLLGSGAREHALAWKINQSVWANPLYIAPGNPGTAQCGKNIPLDIADFEAIRKFCISEKIEMIVVGPEEPLVNGLYDFFKADEKLKDIYFVGPSKNGAQLEGSKAFAKAFMKRHNIPTASYREFDAAGFEEGVHYVKEHSLPVVLKADGLAAGKGVVVCQTHVEAVAEMELMLHQEKFGEASRRVVVEEFLEGIELSAFVITDGKNYLLLPEAKDYKQIGEGNTGLNTGGMGAVSPVPFATVDFMRKVEERVIRPTINGIYQEGIEYVGFLFFGLMNVKGEPYVIEYNCRLGDPETEVIMPRLETDLVGLMIAATQQELDTVEVRVDERAAVTIMTSSFGYPAAYEKGYEIKGLNNKFGKEVLVFHAGTKEENGKIITSGGRVFCVTSYGRNIQEAAEQSLEVLDHIEFDSMYYRTDIGFEFIKHELQ